MFPDIKKKKAVRNNIDPRFGRGGGGAMNVPGGIGVGGASPAAALRGDRGDVGGRGRSPAGVGGVGSDMLPVMMYAERVR